MNDVEFKGLILVIIVIIIGSGALLAIIGWHKWKKPEFVRLIEWKTPDYPESHTFQMDGYSYLLRSSLRPVKKIDDWPNWEDYHVPETYTRYKDGQLI